jgi:hypothetical protein
MLAHEKIGTVELALDQVRVDDKGASNEIWLDIMGKHNGHDGKLCLQITSDKPQPVYQTFTEIQLEKNLDTSAPKPEAIGEACSVSRTGSSEVRDDGQKVSPEQLEEIKAKLPPGWKAYWSQTKGKPYYKHKATNVTVWNIPTE